MALVMTPIYTQTVGAGGTITVNFNNIPQIYTDLLLKFSIRGSSSNGTSEVGLYLNGVGFPASSSYTTLTGNGSSAFSGRNSNFISLGIICDASNTANTFSSHEAYIPNYASTNFKQLVIESVTETNGTTVAARLTSALNRQTTALTSMSLDMGGNSFVQHSTFSLYGIIRSGA